MCETHVKTYTFVKTYHIVRFKYMFFLYVNYTPIGLLQSKNGDHTSFLNA